MALKKELLTRITQLDDDESIRKKICFIVAELARSLMGKIGPFERSTRFRDCRRERSIAMARSDGISLSIGQFGAQRAERIRPDHFRVRREERNAVRRQTFVSFAELFRAFSAIRRRI